MKIFQFFVLVFGAIIMISCGGGQEAEPAPTVTITATEGPNTSLGGQFVTKIKWAVSDNAPIQSFKLEVAKENEGFTTITNIEPTTREQNVNCGLGFRYTYRLTAILTDGTTATTAVRYRTIFDNNWVLNIGRCGGQMVAGLVPVTDPQNNANVKNGVLMTWVLPAGGDFNGVYRQELNNSAAPIVQPIHNAERYSIDPSVVAGRSYGYSILPGGVPFASSCFRIPFNITIPATTTAVSACAENIKASVAVNPANSQRTIFLNWEGATAALVGYKIERTENAGQTWTPVLTPIDNNVLSTLSYFADSGLQAGRTYQYRLTPTVPNLANTSTCANTLSNAITF